MFNRYLVKILLSKHLVRIAHCIPCDSMLYSLARYLGDRTLSYNQFLTFLLILRAPANVNRMYTHADVAIEGANGAKVGVVIYGGIPQTIPSEEPLTFRFRYDE